MLYRLGFWLGPTPSDPIDACAALNQHIFAADHAWGETGTAVPPVPRIAAFVQEALRRYPLDEGDEDPDVDGEDGAQGIPIWKYTDVEACAAGQAFHANLTGLGAEIARDDLAELAASLDINAFDLVQHRILPDRRPGAAPGEQHPHPDVLPPFLAREERDDVATGGPLRMGTGGETRDFLALERAAYSPGARVCDGPERAQEALGLHGVVIPQRAAARPLF
ncbi:hypothetical protein I8D64_01195 [Brachybacterium sp. MASK1Z-5]|uniref:Uncharacterized protein n=1 Tax=Brachybacterium halotolerans TaxID=2795215 RepID=A0ABS1B5W0_9MICO|nr:hypothetical protein [Brachybacterium halotolerans]MBK0330021.1 hypothetical protein [Brachybacterium halotolerans]